MHGSRVSFEVTKSDQLDPNFYAEICRKKEPETLLIE